MIKVKCSIRADLFFLIFFILIGPCLFSEEISLKQAISGFTDNWTGEIFPGNIGLSSKTFESTTNETGSSLSLNFSNDNIPAGSTHIFLQPESPGRIENIGIIKTIEIQIDSISPDDEIQLAFSDSMGQTILVQMETPGDAHFRPPEEFGRKRIVWDNPLYIQQVRNREMFRLPVNRLSPFVDFRGILLKFGNPEIPRQLEIFDVIVKYDKARIE